MIIHVLKDAAGNVINIGDWDYMYVMQADNQFVPTNPIPEGAYWEEAEIEVQANGARVVVELEPEE